MAYDKISLSDLFDFGDSSELDKALASIQRLQGGYEAFARSLKDDNGESRKAVQALSRSLTSLEKKLLAVNVASEAGRKHARAYSLQVQQDVKAINELRTGQEQLITQIRSLEQENRRLQNAYEKIQIARQKAKKSTDTEIGTLGDLKRQLKEAQEAYDKLWIGNKPGQEQALAKVKELAQTVNYLQGAMNNARKSAITAAGSYAGLVAENARLAKQLREMPGAFDRVTGAINKNNKEALQMMEQYRKNTEMLKKFDAQMGLQQRNVGNYGMIAGGMKGMITDLALQLAATVSLAEAARAAFQSNLELSDAQAGVRKTVGMTKVEVDELAESFKQIDTRTSLNGLFEIARIGGQFGIAKDEIEEFTSAANMAAVALSDEFKGGVEEVATELYTLRGLFADTRDLSPADAMLAIGSAVNTLGAEGAATGPVIAEFAKRLGQLGKMGPSIDIALGLGAAFQEMGLSAEIASGGYSNFIIQAQKNTAEFAKLLNMSEKEFRRLLNADPNEVFLRTAEASKAMPDAIKQLADVGVMSQESIKVLSAAADRLDFVRLKIQQAGDAMKEGKSITNEYAIVNDTLAGSWEKLKNAVRNYFTSGSVGNFLKREIDGLRLYGKELSNLFGGTKQFSNQKATSAFLLFNAKNTGISETVAQLNDLIAQYDAVGKSSADAGVKQAQLSIIQQQLSGILGETAVQLNRETGAWELNMVAVRKAAKEKEGANAAAEAAIAQSLNKTKEAIRAAESEIDVNKRRVQILEKERYLYQDNQFGDAALKNRDDLRKANAALSEAENQRNNLLEDQRKAMEELTKAGYDQVAVNAILQREWLRTADAVKMGEAVWGKKTGPGLNIARDPNKDYKDEGDPGIADVADDEKNKKELKLAQSMAQAAANLRELRQQVKLARQELNDLELEDKVSDIQKELSTNPAEDFDRQIRLLQMLQDAKASLIDKNVADEIQQEQFAASQKVQAAKDANDAIQKDSDATDEEKKQSAKNTQEAIGLIIQASALKITAIREKAKDDHASILREEVLDVAAAEKAKLLWVQNMNAEKAIGTQTDYADSAGDAFEARNTDGAFGNGSNMFMMGGGNIGKEVATRISMLESWYKEEDKLAEFNKLRELANAGDSVEKRAEIEEKYRREKLQRDKELEKKTTDVKRKGEEERLELMRAGFDLAGELAAAAFDVGNAWRAQEMEVLRNNKAEELAVVGDNKAAQVEIEERYRTAELKQKRKQAKIDKVQALFNIALSTSKGIMEAVAAFPLTLGMPWSGIIGAMGAIQAAAVIAKPMPQYWRGTKSSMKGYAQIAEKGPELLEHNGTFQLATTPQVKMLQHGTRVYNAEDTQGILSHVDELSRRGGVQSLVPSLDVSSDAIMASKRDEMNTAARLVKAVGKSSQTIVQAIRQQKPVSISVDQRGVTQRIGHTSNEYRNRKYNR